MALVNAIPNQYAREGIAYSYTFPIDTFNGATPTYTAVVNRPIIGRALPSWLTFNPATRTFSGTPTKWWELETLQIVVEADVATVKSYSIFILTVGAADNVGRICWRAGNTPNHILTAANIAAFDTGTVSAGQWVSVSTDITKDPVIQAYKDKFTAIRARGGFLVWLWNNVNGFSSGNVNRFDFDLVHEGETLAIDFSAGNTRAFQPYGNLWRGLRGKEIYVTNYNVPGFITLKDWQDLPNRVPIRCTRSTVNQERQDRHLRFIGQPNNHVPFINLYGLGCLGGIGWQIDGSNGYIEAAFIDMKSDKIGFHWKPNTTATAGDRRSALNLNGWDMNQRNEQIHDCFSIGGSAGGEAVYLGGGGWDGATVKVYHLNPDGTKKMVLNNGISVQEYHNIRRFNSTHEYVRIEHNIFLQSGWDAIQTRCVVKEQRIMYNYIFETAKSSTVNMVQAEGIITDGGVGEVAYNYIERAWNAGLRVGMIGLDSIHHNVIVDTGQYNYGNAVLDPTKGGIGIYGNDRGLIYADVPQLYIQGYRGWDILSSYNYDSFQHDVKVKYLNKSYRSLQADNFGNQPNISPTWWEDTTEWVSYVARPEITAADLFYKCFNNTIVNAKFETLKLFSATPTAKRWVYNNLFINCGQTSITAGTGANVGGNIMLTGIVLANYFVDPANKDYRLKAGASAIGAGVDLSAFVADVNAFHDGFKDYCGGTHTAPPSVGAMENGAVKDTKYNWAVNSGTAPPPPITINAGVDKSFNLPQNSISITAIKSDPARVLTTTQWVQISGPSAATIVNGATLTATFSALVAGVYVFRINTIDVYNQNASDGVRVTVNIEGSIILSSFQWYIANDSIGTGKAPIPDTNMKAYTPTPYVGQNKWFARGERPMAKTGTLIGVESLSNWVNVT